MHGSKKLVIIKKLAQKMLKQSNVDQFIYHEVQGEISTYLSIDLFITNTEDIAV